MAQQRKTPHDTINDLSKAIAPNLGIFGATKQSDYLLVINYPQPFTKDDGTPCEAPVPETNQNMNDVDRKHINVTFHSKANLKDTIALIIERDSFEKAITLMDTYIEQSEGDELNINITLESSAQMENFPALKISAKKPKGKLDHTIVFSIIEEGYLKEHEFIKAKGLHILTELDGARVELPLYDFIVSHGEWEKEMLSRSAGEDPYPRD